MRRAVPWVAAIAALVALDVSAVRAIAAPVAQAPVPPAAPATAVGSAPGPIAATQQELQRQGYSPGPANGVMTSQTERAIRLYERRNGHPPDALAAGTGPANPVRRAQAGLQALGLLRGRPDGAIGPRTRDAVIRFEAAQHLPIDPRISDRLLAEIDKEIAAKTAGTASQTEVPAAQVAATPRPPAAAETGRRALPAGVNPPPIR